MFTKPFKCKSSNSLKSSFRKVLSQKIQAAYPVVTEDDLKEMIPAKASITALKTVTSADQPVTVYVVDDTPCALEIEDALYPTVHTLWKCPRMLKTISLEPHLGDRLKDGIIHVRRSYLPPFGSRFVRFKKGEPLCVNTVDNEAAVLIGTAQYSSDDMLAVQTGICIKTLNIIGDYLCTDEKFIKANRPSLKPPTTVATKVDRVSADVAKLSLNTNESTDMGENEKLDSETTIDEPNESNNTIDGKIPDDTDGLLKYCLLCVFKSQGKKLELPLKTNLLYANLMSSHCPPDKSLDIKKSTYKKLGKFLDAMQQEELLQIKEIEKGVDAVVAVNFSHPLLKEHVVIETFPDSNEDQDTNSFKAPTIREVFKVTAASVPLLTKYDFKKGQTVLQTDIRAALIDYVKRNNLQNENKNLVNIDPILGSFSDEMTISWEDLMSNIQSKMTSCTEICYPDGKCRLISGKLKQITMQVANRSGNKKVTIVSNLEEYGLSLSALSRECQHGVAASCTITRTPGSKTDQLLIQGNQTYFVAKYLTEVYGMPKKFIEGADKILSKKKK